MKTFLSIGSGPGIGHATAERFAREGFRVLLTSRNAQGLLGRAEALRAKGHTVEVETLDAGNLGEVTQLVRSVEARFGAIDVLHFNAASLHAATIETQAPDSFVPDLTVNIGAALVATQEASRLMLARGAGSILLTHGAFALKPNPDYLSLSIGKAGLRAMTMALFDPFKQRGVHIAAVMVDAMVAPGSEDALAIADKFWQLHSEEPGAWTPEVTYRAAPKQPETST